MTHASSCRRQTAGAVAGLAAVTAWLAAASAAAWEIAPHRALYRLELDRSRPASGVSNVTGQMAFEWADSCDGWTVEQRYRLNFSYAQGQDVEVTSVYATWESKDGSRFNFNMRSSTNGVVDEEVRGKAILTGHGGGMVEYRLPEETRETLPPETLFPTAHSLRLLTEAESGTRFFNATLFDGTELDGLVQLSAAIGNRIEPAGAADAQALLERPSWPVTLAFFSLSEPVMTPDYEMFLTIHDNGVVDALTVDYGDFVVEGELMVLEALDAPACPPG